MLPFFSRHIPTPAQQATVADRFGELVCAGLVFEPGRVAAQVAEAVTQCAVRDLGARFGERDLIFLVSDGQSDGHAHQRDAGVEHPYRAYQILDETRREWCVAKMVAGVFPGWALLELLRAGWTVVEFQNEPSARARGVFVCRGAFVHTLDTTEYLPCPVPVDRQEA